MNNIILYKDKNGNCEIADYLKLLSTKEDKDSTIKFNKIIAYINMLSKYGLQLREPYIKRLNTHIWELRPLRDRILFSYFDNNTFVLLSVFMKQTRKTPIREIRRAICLLKDFKKRSGINE